MIPFVDLEGQYRRIRKEVLLKIEEVLESRAFIQGPYVAEFEREFVKMLGANHGAGCSSGTSALFLALAGLGIGPGDEVITVPNTFIATAEAICHAGAKPVFVDIDPATYCLDTGKIEGAITERTKAIIPVHLYGNPCDMDGIQALAGKHGLFVIEDCAQSHLATYRGKFTGTFGDAAAYSFFPGKNLGAYGDAGFVMTRTEDLSKKIHKLLNHGRANKFDHDVIGYNHRMDGIQAAVLSVKLKYLAEWTRARQRNAKIYDTALKQSGFKVIHPTEGSEPVYHLYVAEVANRQEVMDSLKEKGISTSIHYPIPLHLQPAFGFLGYRKGDFPVSEGCAERIVSLPMCGELREEKIETITREFKKTAKPV